MNINKICGFGFEIDEAADMNEIVENISYDSRQELNKISRQKNEKTIFEEKKEAQEKFNSAAHLYEEYDEVAFERKLRIESLFFEHLFESLDNSELKLSEALGSFYKTVREIYEMINIDYDMVSELNNQSITYCDDKIFVTTDGFGAYLIDTQDREVCNIAYLPIESDELTIQPYNITPTATNMQVPINYANPLAGGNSLISFNNIYVNKPQAAVHGYTGTTIDYKTYFSLTTLPVSLPHLNVLPMLIKKDGSLKMAIFTTYENGNNIYISGNKSTMNVYNLEHNYLLR